MQTLFEVKLPLSLVMAFDGDLSLRGQNPNVSLTWALEQSKVMFARTSVSFQRLAVYYKWAVRFVQYIMHITFDVKFPIEFCLDYPQ